MKSVPDCIIHESENSNRKK